ncbi:TIGR04211 family SH3 domain-containing protein [Litchfieldella xinjiangensis]|uniref:TIGR04211 family SH3 domain-containing protein n=1 Tax=Litchfieldella xinjiangensis TaxID=1166948 RepID=UPI000693E015|nr:TIGR04211 family SH3 domain-containing protein [Halomonas xinjiangensis]
MPVAAQDSGDDAQAGSDGQRWVSDELTTFVRSGPTDGYRIVGTLTAGEPVTVLDTSGDYTQVRDSDGESVWILSSELQSEPSAIQRLPEVQERVMTLSEELEGINSEWQGRVASMTETLEARDERIQELEARNNQLDRQANEAQQTIRGLQARLDTQEEDLLMRYFMYGGGVAGAGLVVGLLVPHLPRRRKKRDRWF